MGPQGQSAYAVAYVSYAESPPPGFDTNPPANPVNGMLWVQNLPGARAATLFMWDAIAGMWKTV